LLWGLDWEMSVGESVGSMKAGWLLLVPLLMPLLLLKGTAFSKVDC